MKPTIRSLTASSLLSLISLLSSGLLIAQDVRLDFDYFKNEVQPIYLAKRDGNVRCIQCHTRSSNFRIQPLEEHQLFWTDEQSRMNFESASQFILPGEDPLRSRFLTHPLSADAGGDPFHGGGKHFHSQFDGSQIYITNEAMHSLDIVDARTLRVKRRIPLSGRPNNLGVTSDGSKVYVAIMEMPGSVDIIDVATMTNIKTLPVNGAIHNVYVTPDSRFAVAGSIQTRTINVIDTRTDEVAWELEMSSGIRPMTFDTKADGSTKNIFVQLSGFHGFAVVDFDKREEVARVEHPAVPGEEAHMDGLQGAPAHGLAVSPDGKTLWSTSKVYSHVYIHSLPDLNEIGRVFVGQHPEWITFTPDGKRAYIGAAGDNVTYAVDAVQMKTIAKIGVGQVPKRIAMVHMALD